MEKNYFVQEKDVFDLMQVKYQYPIERCLDAIKKKMERIPAGGTTAMVKLENLYTELEKIYHDYCHNIRRWVCNQPILICPPDDMVYIRMPNGDTSLLDKVLTINYVSHKSYGHVKKKQALSEKVGEFNTDDFFKNATPTW